MIFIITHKKDYTVDYIVNKLNFRGISYYRFNCEDLDNKKYLIRLGDENYFDINKVKNVHSVWFRRTMVPLLEGCGYDIMMYLQNEYNALLSNIYHVLSPTKWLSEPRYVYEAENKLLQLMIARRIGFIIPDTIISNSKEEVIRFFNKNKSNVIIKPLSQGRIVGIDEHKIIFTSKIDLHTQLSIDKYTLTPSIIQNYIDKIYEVRVTVVDNKVFAAKIDSQQNTLTSIDWRKGKTKSEKYDLPIQISNMCIRLVKILNLSFGAIDLIKSKDGSYVFLEINPNGQWAWIENETGLNISDAIIEYLTT
jgi:hypothetical protein